MARLRSFQVRAGFLYKSCRFRPAMRINGVVE